MKVTRFTKPKKFKFPIKGRNAERDVNEHIQGLMDFRYDRLSEITFEGNEITVFIVFDSWRVGDGYRKRVIAKQFSKKKYASCDDGIRKFAENGKKKGSTWIFDFQWQELLRIEQETYWLVIFEEIR